MTPWGNVSVAMLYANACKNVTLIQPKLCNTGNVTSSEILIFDIVPVILVRLRPTPTTLTKRAIPHSQRALHEHGIADGKSEPLRIAPALSLPTCW